MKRSSSFCARVVTPMWAKAGASTVSTCRKPVMICGSVWLSVWLLSLVTSSFAAAGDQDNLAKANPGRAETTDTRPLGARSEKVLKPLSGRTVYKRVCMACHTLNVWGAPKLGDRAAWALRISKGRPALYFSAKNGFNKMPARGYCDFCTDAELESAVDYMVEKAQPREKGR